MEKTNLNIPPYYDDFDESKNFHKMLYRPEYAVQGRELNQSQTILQNQVERLGSHTFKDGSAVKDGLTNYYNDVNYVKLETTIGGLPIDIAALDGVELIDTVGRGSRARVIAYSDSEGVDPPTIMVRYLTGEVFAPGDTLALASAPATGVVKIRAESDALGLGSIATIQEGIFFVRGHFVRVAQQVVILNKYDTTPTYDVGLEINEAIITPADDTTLLDPALDAANFQAPGAHRLQITLTLNKRATSSADLEEFVRLMKIEGGDLVEWIRYPVYSEIEKTLARRTYDESGNYTVRPFRAMVSESNTNTSNYLVTLDPGKAYVFGYEFETIFPTRIEVPKPRKFETVGNYPLNINFGNYAYVTNANGFVDSSSFEQVDLHCINSANINLASATAYTNTKIGTARVRDLSLYSAPTASQANSYVYRAYLFDVNTYSYTGNAAAGTINTIQFGTDYANAPYAYEGAIIRITAGPGAGDRRYINSYNFSTKTATVSENFSIIPTTASQYSIDFQFKDTESICVRRVSGTNAFFDIATSSKDLQTIYNDSVLSDTAYDKLFFELPYSYIVATDASNAITSISDVSYQYRKVFSGVLTANTLALTTTGAEQFVGSIGVQSASQKQDNWFAVVTTPGGSTPFGRGAVIPLVDSTHTITLNNSQSANVTIGLGYTSTVSIYARVSVTASGRKNKTLISANTLDLASTSATAAYDKNGTLVNNITIYASNGQVDFSNTSLVRYGTDPSFPIKLYLPDVVSIAKVVDSQNVWANVSAADLTNTAKDITARYVLDNGQRDGYYDHASIRLKPGMSPPSGCVRVWVNYYNHDTNQGYFCVDSYPNANNQSGYSAIKNYTSPKGTVYSLRDVIDFRPRKQIGYANSFVTPISVAAAASTFNLDFAYYLARIDHLVLTRDRRFEVIQGVDSLKPTPPKDRDDAMLLHILSVPQYVEQANVNINIKSLEHKRYTMRDIGALEKRINSLEYYTSLSLLELQALNRNDQTVYDDAGLIRTKNGIIVDSFDGFNASAVAAEDFVASIDPVNKRMMPGTLTRNYDAFFFANTSTNYKTDGHTVSLPWSLASFTYQNTASKTTNVNPFNVTTWAGNIGMSPPNDSWVDVLTLPPRYIGAYGPARVVEVLYSQMTLIWHGELQTSVDSQAARDALFQSGYNAIGQPWSYSSGGYDPLTTAQLAAGVSYQVNFWKNTTAQRITDYTYTATSQGYRVLNTAINPTIRSRQVVYRSKNMRPNTAYYPFFNGTSVINYVKRSNVIEVSASNPGGTGGGTFNEELRDTYGAPDFISVFNNYPPNSYTWNGTLYNLVTFANGVGTIVDSMSPPNVFFNSYTERPANGGWANTTTNAVIGYNFNQWASNAFWRHITRYEHYSGNVVSNVSSTIVQISPDAHANAYFFTPSIGTQTWKYMGTLSSAQWSALGADGKIRIVNGTGAGQERTITAYDVTTNRITVSSPFSPVPDSSSQYSIGVPRSTRNGHIAGTFCLPNTAAVQFTTGQKIFRLIDNATNDDVNATSFGEGTYSGQGVVREQQETINITRNTLSDTISSYYTIHVQQGTRCGGIQGDPIAQSFYVDPRAYPYGVTLASARFCFQSKDGYLPVRLQIRPMVNGYPHSKDYITEVVLDPQYVKTSDSPNLADSSKYTEFVFPAPIYFAPDKEYAIVLLSDSNAYNVFSAEVGKPDVVTKQVISEQPTLGSLFKSQNGSTWTAAQTEDLMFALYACQYTVGTTANVSFRIKPTTANVNTDVFMFTTSQLMPPGTDIAWKYATELISGGMTPLKDFTPSTRVSFDDNLGRRVFVGNSNATFQAYATLTTVNQWVSPMIDLTYNMSVFSVEHYINNGELSNNLIAIIDGGTGYLPTDNSNLVITISGGGGSGAAAKVNAISNGSVTEVVMTSPGSGYASNPNVSISFTGNTTMRAANSNLSFVIVGEGYNFGGNMNHRYIMRSVTLAEGMDSSDIRLYLTAYKPSGSQIYVYYRVLSAGNVDVIENKAWQLMTQIGNSNVNSKNKNDVIEFTYAPGSGGVPSQEIIVDGYNTFKTFQVKICTTATNPADCAEILDVRAIALPTGKV